MSYGRTKISAFICQKEVSAAHLLDLFSVYLRQCLPSHFPGFDGLKTDARAAFERLRAEVDVWSDDVQRILSIRNEKDAAACLRKRTAETMRYRQRVLSTHDFSVV